MFADPQSLTIATVATSFPAVARNTDKSVYQTADGTNVFTIARTYGKRSRFSIRLDNSKYATDPLVPANLIPVSTSVYIVIDTPAVGYTQTERQNLAKALRDWATDANILKVLGGET